MQKGLFWLDGGPSSEKPVYLSDELLADFENEDREKTVWTGNVTSNGNIYYYPLNIKLHIPMRQLLNTVL